MAARDLFTIWFSSNIVPLTVPVPLARELATAERDNGVLWRLQRRRNYHKPVPGTRSAPLVTYRPWRECLPAKMRPCVRGVRPRVWSRRAPLEFDLQQRPCR